MGNPISVKIVRRFNSETDPRPPRLLDRVRERLRARHYSPRTEDAYVSWIKRYIRFNRMRTRRSSANQRSTRSSRVLLFAAG